MDFRTSDRVRVETPAMVYPTYPEREGSVGMVLIGVPENEWDSEHYLVQFDDGKSLLFFHDGLKLVEAVMVECSTCHVYVRELDSTGACPDCVAADGCEMCDDCGFSR